MASKIQIRRDTAARWTTFNPILSLGEPGAERDTGRMKVGDGVQDWNSLPYVDETLGGGTGFTGSQGNVGFTGSQGIQGIVGFTGSQGAQGNIGFTGSRGNTGFTGSQGITGPQGNVGFTGSAGASGFTGSQGITGPQGNVGFTGSVGIGFTGSQGNTGFTGSQGIQGFTGSAGTGGGGFWTFDPVIRTSDFTAQAGMGYFVDTTGQPADTFVTLPAAPNQFDIVYVRSLEEIGLTSVFFIDPISTIELPGYATAEISKFSGAIHHAALVYISGFWYCFLGQLTNFQFAGS